MLLVFFDGENHGRYRCRSEKDLLNVDLANPDTVDAGGEALHRELIYINRRQFIWHGAYNELLMVHNFDRQPHVVTISMHFAADFADIFEIRGQPRAKRGRRSAGCESSDTVVLRYSGVDGVERATMLRFEPAPLRLDTQYAQFVLTLKGGEGKRIVLRISCRAPAKQAWNIREYYRALRASRDALRPALAPIAGDLARWLDDRKIKHLRGAPYHPVTQG